MGILLHKIVLYTRPRLYTVAITSYSVPMYQASNASDVKRFRYQTLQVSGATFQESKFRGQVSGVKV